MLPYTVTSRHATDICFICQLNNKLLDINKAFVYRRCKEICAEDGCNPFQRRKFETRWNKILPYIVTAHPAIDLCFTCQQNNKLMDINKEVVYRRYKEACAEDGCNSFQRRKFEAFWNEVLPYIVTARTATDICFTCQQNNKLIQKSINLLECVSASVYSKHYDT